MTSGTRTRFGTTSWLLIPVLVCFSGFLVSAMRGPSIDLSTPESQRNPRFISFDTNSGKIDINLDLSVPFLSIPLEDKNENGGLPMPLLNVNTKALAIFGVLMALSAFVVPVLVKKLPEVPNGPSADLHHHHYRSDRGLDLWHLGDSINEILFRDGRVTPCLQRVVCSAIAAASRSANPTSIDKIIDGLSSHRWFEQISNGTLLKDAVLKGREALGLEECTTTYKGCLLNQQMVANVLKIVGI